MPNELRDDQFAIRFVLPRELAEQVKEAAKLEHRSTTGQIIHFLYEALRRRNAQQPDADVR